MVYGRLYNYYKSLMDYEAAKKYVLIKYDISGGHDLSKLYLEIKNYLN